VGLLCAHVVRRADEGEREVLATVAQPTDQ
jgi:hypothetical protein